MQRSRVLRRCKWYTESDHILTMIYNMLTGGARSATSTGSETIREQSGYWYRADSHATTTGDFLARFGEDRNAVALSELREVGD